MPHPPAPLHVSRVPRAPHRTGTPPFLPQELIDLLIYEFEGDLATIAILGPVSQAWYPRSRAHLFKRVYIGGKEPKKRCPNLLDLLKEKAVLQQCILEFVLANDEGKQPWLGKSGSTSRAIAAILPLLTHLRRISITGSNSFHWKINSRVLHAALCKAMEQPSVTQLSFSSIKGLDVEFIAKLHHVKTLCFDNFIEDYHPLRPALGQPPALTEDSTPRLDILDITTCGYILRNLFAAAAAPGGAHHILYPKEIYVSTLGWDEDMEDAWDFVLRVGAPTVLRYTIFQDAYPPLKSVNTPPFPLPVLDLSRFTNLTEFTITIAGGFINYQMHNPIPLLLKAFGQLSQSTTPTNMQKIRLEFDFRDAVDPEEEDEDEDEEDEPNQDRDLDIIQSMCELSQAGFWSKFDETLVREAFSRLEEVKVLFNIAYCFELPERDWTNARDRTANAMKRLDGRKGILKIER